MNFTMFKVVNLFIHRIDLAICATTLLDQSSSRFFSRRRALNTRILLAWLARVDNPSISTSKYKLRAIN